MIILVGGEKGGSGKTTIATNLAAMLAEHGRDTLLVDTDPQGSASFWAEARQEDATIPKNLTTVQKHGRSVGQEIQQLSPRFQDVVIDSGGRDSAELRAAMLIAHVILVPSRPSMYDIHSLALMDRLVGQSQQFNPGLQAFVVVNGASTNVGNADVSDMLEVLEDFDYLKVTGTVLRDRLAYRRSAAKGLSVNEFLPRDAKAAEELSGLYEEVTALGKVAA
jgi:chromosome partitioning protein